MVIWLLEGNKDIMDSLRRCDWLYFRPECFLCAVEKEREATMKQEKLLRDAVSVHAAITHALSEAYNCIERSNFCAGVAMMRKSVDLWSKDWRDSNKITFSKRKRENDNLYWRLKKFAAQNPAYEESVHHIIDALRIQANEALHDATICPEHISRPGRFPTPYHDLRVPFHQVHDLVESVIKATTKPPPY